MSRYNRHEPCNGCHRVFLTHELTEVTILEAKATHSSPAEYGDVLLCADCLEADERDLDYERANLRFKEDTGSEL